MYKKILLPVLLTFIISSQSLGQIHNPDGTPESKDTVPQLFHFVLGNWINPMDVDGCIILGKFRELEIRNVIYLGTNQLESYPGIHISTQFHGGDVQISAEPVKAALLEEIELFDGGFVYKYETVAYTGDFAEECITAPTPSVPIIFEYNISIVDVNGNPYPIDQHPGLLEITNAGESTDHLIEPTLTYAGTKELCCDGVPIFDPTGEATRVNPTGGLFVQQTSYEDVDAQSTTTMVGATAMGAAATDIDERNREPIQTTTMSSLSNSLGVVPNPFNGYLKVGFHASKSSVTSIQLWDVNGRLIDQLEYQSGSTSVEQIQMQTNQLEAGFYYCTIKNDRYTKTYKVLKINQ